MTRAIRRCGLVLALLAACGERAAPRGTASPAPSRKREAPAVSPPPASPAPADASAAAPSATPASASARAPEPDASAAPSAAASGEQDGSVAAKPRTAATSAGSRPARFDNFHKGETEAEVRAEWGEPDTQRGERWEYRLPRDCSDWETIYSLRFQAGRIVEIGKKRHYTGQNCGEP